LDSTVIVVLKDVLSVDSVKPSGMVHGNWVDMVETTF